MDWAVYIKNSIQCNKCNFLSKRQILNQQIKLKEKHIKKLLS
ncbi:hypothetical protein D049_3906 [Vibrio parahaemolyticus VPTS-2010]|nr:hypothetical protein D049_3906 [Vibrio parahaemolyticus VPTS-2010]